MSVIFSTIYLIILLLFLLIFTFYVSKEIIRIVREEKLINIIRKTKTTQKFNRNQHLELINLYLYRKIFDAAIYELNFVIANFDCDKENLSLLYNLLGQSYNQLGITHIAFKQYYKALNINPQNEFSLLQIIKKLIEEKKYNEAIKKCESFLQDCPNSQKIRNKLKQLKN